MKKSRFLTAYMLIIALLVTSVMPMHLSAQAQAATAGELNKKKVSLYIGQRVRLKVQNTEEEIYWSTSDKRIAKVNQNGRVSARKPGVATITATLGKTKQSVACEVVVGKYAAKLILNSAENVILKEGETAQIDVTITPAKVLKDNVTYQSANAEIASVDASGEITARKQGLTQITVVTKAKNKKGKKLRKTISVYVQPAEENAGNTGNTGATGNGATGNGTTDTASKPVVEKITVENTQTYVLDKNYTDPITISLTMNGKTWKSATTVEAVLDDLEHSWATKENGDKTMQVKKAVGDEWWVVTDLTTEEVLFRIKAEESYEQNMEYGQIIVEQQAGNVSISIR